jgi:putative transposase
MMPKQIRAYKYRVYPTKEQSKFLDSTFGCVRFVWNQLVANFNSYSKDGPNRPMDEKILKDMPEFSWLNDTISYALQQKRMDFIETKKQYFNPSRKTKLGRMKFKKKGVSTDSFRIPGQAIGFNKFINFDTSKIKLPKMSPLKVVIDRKFYGQVKSVTVSKNKTNQYFVSVLVEEDVVLYEQTGKTIGVDLGLTDLCILSNGMKISNPKWFRKNQAKLKTAQQHFSRKQEGSNRREIQRTKVARIHREVSNQRSFIHHNISSWLVKNYDTIVMEDLNIKGMLKNRKLSKSISDASWSSLVSMISYKSNWRGRTFHKIDRFYPSSKTCSSCGHRIEKMELSIREWDCPSCGSHHNRDLNAAVNIYNKGMNDLYGFTSDESADYRHREDVSLLELPKATSLKCLVSFIDFYKTA